MLNNNIKVFNCHNNISLSLLTQNNLIYITLFDYE